MPLYEYQCRACGHRFERIRKFSDPPLAECPECAGVDVEKLLSAPAIQFKGAGWYITDYARKKEGGTSSGSDAASSDSGSSGSDKAAGGGEKTASDTKGTKDADTKGSKGKATSTSESSKSGTSGPASASGTTSKDSKG
jgi:putative FmdB family regulatory protein